MGDLIASFDAEQHAKASLNQRNSWRTQSNTLQDSRSGRFNPQLQDENSVARVISR